MNVYQRICVFLLRWTGFVSLVLGINGFLYTLLLSYSAAFQLGGITAGEGLLSGAYYFVIGLAFVLFSGPLGKVLGRGLDDKSDGA